MFFLLKKLLCCKVLRRSFDYKLLTVCFLNFKNDIGFFIQNESYSEHLPPLFFFFTLNKVLLLHSFNLIL